MTERRPTKDTRPLRSELAHIVEHPYGASRRAARCSTPRAAPLPLPAWVTLGLLRHAAHLVWLKQNYKSVSDSEPQPMAQVPPAAHIGSPPHPRWSALPRAPGATATGALDPVSRPHMRRNMVNTRATGGGNRLGASRCASSLWEPKRALGECRVNPRLTLA